MPANAFINNFPCAFEIFSVGKNYPKFPKEPLAASVLFLGQGITIIRRAVFNDVSNVNTLSFEIYGGQHFGQKFSRCAHEWPALLVFFLPRRFADKNNLRFRTAVPRHRLQRGGPKFASAFRFPFRVQFLEFFSFTHTAILQLDYQSIKFYIERGGFHENPNTSRTVR